MSRRTSDVRTATVLAFAPFFLGGCSSSATLPPDGGPPRALEVVGQSQLGLHYNQTAALAVRYRIGEQPLVGQQVRFSIFGDPVGSTLSRDRAVTGDDGVAQVTLTAGASEASFRVLADAENVPDAELDVDVSKLDFVEIDVALAFPGPPAAASLQALLYQDHACAELPPSANPLPPDRQVMQAGASATLGFMNLIPRDYAVVGRGLDANGHLIAGGCADVPAALIPAGSTKTLRLPLEHVAASPIGSFAIASELTVQAAPITAPWHALAACPLGVAGAILDGVAQNSSEPTQQAIAGERGAADASGCRPPMVSAGGNSSLDAELQALLDGTGAPLGKFSAIVDDLDAIVASCEVDSTLTIQSSGPGRLDGTHQLGALVLADAAGTPANYDLGLAGLPIVTASDIAVSADATSITIGPHAFTLGLPGFWARALGDLALATRGISPPTSRGLLGAIADAASHGGKQGCAAVEDLVCTATGAANCAGAIEPACEDALDGIAQHLDAGFAVAGGLDLTLQGQALAVDSTGMLIVDHLESGAWTPTGAASGTFSGMRAP